MKILLTLCAIAALAVGNASASDERVGLFKNVTGAVTVVRSSGDLPATAGMPLHKADKVVTQAGGSGGIVFTDGTTLSVGSATEVDIRDYAFDAKSSRFAFDVYLAKGTAVYSSGKIGKLAPQAVAVSTPKATVGVRGTRFIIQAE